MAMNPPPQSLLEFPCTLPIKIMGAAAADFEPLVLDIIRRHVGAPAPGAVRTRPSRNGRYVAITVTIEARDRAQLEALYEALSAHKQVLMTL